MDIFLFMGLDLHNTCTRRDRAGKKKKSAIFVKIYFLMCSLLFFHARDVYVAGAIKMFNYAFVENR